MTFAQPIALALAVIWLPILALYILKVRLRRVPVSTNLFWKQIYDEKPPRSMWQQLRHLASLLLQILFLLLLILAVADPLLSSQRAHARRMVVILDTSASMKSSDVQPSRFEAARSEALSLIEGMRSHDQLAVLSAGSTPKVVSSLTEDTAALKRAISALECTDDQTKLDTAVSLATRLCPPETQAHIYLFTDGAVDEKQIQNIEQIISPKTPDPRTATESVASSDQGTPGSDPISSARPHEVTWRLFGTNTFNVGITQFQSRRSLTDPLGYQVLVTVRNASAEPLSCRLELTLDDSLIDVLPLTLAPEEAQTRTLDKTSVSGGVLDATLTQIRRETSLGSASTTDAPVPYDSSLDALVTDNHASAILPDRKTQKVHLVTRGNVFLQKALEANPIVALEVSETLPAAGISQEEILVLHGPVPAILPGGKVLVVDPETECDLWKITSTVTDPLITQQDASSPLMAHFRLDNVIVPRARGLTFVPRVRPLVSTDTGDVLYGEVHRPTGSCLVLAVNLEESDLAFRTAFPILITNAIAWFAGQSGELQNAWSTGQQASLEIPRPLPQSSQQGAVQNSAAETCRLISPDGRRHSVATRPSAGSPDARLSVTTAPLTVAGTWHIRTGPPPAAGMDEDPESTVAHVAVNIASQRESDLRPSKAIPENQFDNHMNQSTVRPLWFWLTIVALVLSVCEWGLYHRRVVA